MVLEIAKHVFPNLVGMCLPPANTFQQKKDNWIQLNR